MDIGECYVDQCVSMVIKMLQVCRDLFENLLRWWLWTRVELEGHHKLISVMIYATTHNKIRNQILCGGLNPAKRGRTKIREKWGNIVCDESVMKAC